MVVARNEDHSLVIFGTNEIERKDGKWYCPATGSYGTKIDEYTTVLTALDWEDEPRECYVAPIVPLHKHTCKYCGHKFKYDHSDVHTSYDCQPSSSFYDDGADYVICPECDKMNYL